LIDQKTRQPGENGKLKKVSIKCGRRSQKAEGRLTKVRDGWGKWEKGSGWSDTIQTNKPARHKILLKFSGGSNG